MSETFSNSLRSSSIFLSVMVVKVAWIWCTNDQVKTLYCEFTGTAVAKTRQEGKMTKVPFGGTEEFYVIINGSAWKRFNVSVWSASRFQSRISFFNWLPMLNFLFKFGLHEFPSSLKIGWSQMLPMKPNASNVELLLMTKHLPSSTSSIAQRHFNCPAFHFTDRSILIIKIKVFVCALSPPF